MSFTRIGNSSPFNSYYDFSKIVAVHEGPFGWQLQTIDGSCFEVNETVAKRALAEVGVTPLLHLRMFSKQGVDALCGMMVCTNKDGMLQDDRDKVTCSACRAAMK